MGKTTGIAWCHHTFNPWWGCVEVSPGCDRCYAREWAKRTGHAVWGTDAPRRSFGDKHWREPLKWYRAALQAGERRRVFCASMADVLERCPGLAGARLDEERKRLWDLIRETKGLGPLSSTVDMGLDWLLLTKRARDWDLVPPDVLALPSVWPGVTVESPAYLWRAEALLKVNCAGPRWISYEPALEWVDFEKMVAPCGPTCPGCDDPSIEWVVIGGESQQAAKAGCSRPVAPFDLEWPRRLIRLGRETGTAIFVKQLGSFPIWDGCGLVAHNPPGPTETVVVDGREMLCLRLRDRKGGSPEEWPEDLRDARAFPRGPA